MIACAKAKYVRVSPRKARLVIDLIRGKSVESSFAILSAVNKRAAVYIKKLLRSAVNNAENIAHLNARELYISKITADGGPFLKRYKATAMGRATVIRKRTSHIRVELDKRK
jgi:large subunit ribosomal protein L22